MDQIRGVVERITYHNPENGYAVIKVAVKGHDDRVAVIGNMMEPHVGSVLLLEGYWKTDPKYGRQFSMQKYDEVLPATSFGIEKYLGSGLIKGVGPKFAKKIVQKFSDKTLEVIEEDPDKLLEVEGIGKRRVEQIKKSWTEQKEIKNIMLFLQGHDVSTAHAAKIFKEYGADSISVVRENPYRLADDIWGIGFQTADTIAKKMGFGIDRYVRLRGGLLYALNRLADEGHCYAERTQLVDAAVNLLVPGKQEGLPSIDSDELRGKIEITLDEMLRKKDVILDKEAVYLPAFYFSESGCAKRLQALMNGKRRKYVDAGKVMEKLTSSEGVVYDDVQIKAIQMAVASKVMVLTGGPGTGKTTTTLGIISAYRRAGCSIILAAPTGRAAKRLSEATGMEAKTIHRLLEYNPQGGCKRNGDNPLEGDVLIMDECSMVDVLLMYNVLKAMPEHMVLIMVGDTDQLPSVGAGNVLRDIIHSGTVPVTRLTRIFRQAQGSRIIMNAHRINAGENLDLSGGKDSDFFFSQQDSNEAVADTLMRYCTQNLPKYYHADPMRDIQVLTPMRRGICGSANLNQVLQERLNPSKILLRRGGTQYRLHDKVMQIRNNYNKEVFNGDIGFITDVDMEEQTLTVDMDGRPVKYETEELDELVLAYATTIHKSQGSEYPIVVIPFNMSQYIMLQRNLLYTGVTRAKKVLVLIGEKKAVYYAIRNNKIAQRNTKLSERLRELCQSQSSYLAEQMAGEETYLPEELFPNNNMDGQEDNAGNVAEDIFARLSRSSFRSRFHLKEDRAYIMSKGMSTIRLHAEDFVSKRLAPAEPQNDGKQTPMRGHPVFIAQHATATCCRSCLEKWHGIPKGKELTTGQQMYVVDVIMSWIKKQMYSCLQ